PETGRRMELKYLMSSTDLPTGSLSASPLPESLPTFAELWEDNSALLRTIIEESEDAIFAKDVDGRYLIINSAGARAAGKTIATMVGRTDTEIFPPDLANEIRTDDVAVIDSGRSYSFENTIIFDQSPHIFHSIKMPYHNAEGEIVGIIGIARDITELKRAETSQRLLAKIGEVLSTSLDYEERLTKLAQLAVPHLADWCGVDILTETNLVQRVAVAHTDPSKLALADELYHRYPPDWSQPTGAALVLQTGQAQIYPQITAEMIEAAARDAEQLRLLRAINIRSVMIVPLTAREKTFGVMTFIWAESDRQYDQNDLALAEEIARRAAIAIDNARLYKGERNARREAELTAQRITSMQSVTAALSEAITPLDVAQVVLERGLVILTADSGILSLVDESNTYLEILHSFGYDQQRLKPWQRFPITANLPMAEIIYTGQPVFMETLDNLAERYPEWAKNRISDHNSLAALPLVVEGRVIGSISLSFVQPRTFSAETRKFMINLARQCAQALERARLYQAEKEARSQAEAAQQRLALMTEINERNRLAQELHDTVAQALGYLNLKMSMALMQLDQGQLSEIQESLQELKQIIGETYTDVREEIFNLRNSAVPGGHFLETLQEYVAKYKRFYDLDVQLIQTGDASRFKFPDEVGIQLIRTIQEALINIRKHAQVDEAVIFLSHIDNHIQIRIEDQGRGFDVNPSPTQSASSFGLQIMQERIEKVGGRLEIESEPGEGTRITLHYSF
ncbi:MAG TPA: GAF domain-containing protein, partial [Anaerolineae bacterium]|nr:GAF domain-containing protein [Anaerolineae bacterium]